MTATKTIKATRGRPQKVPKGEFIKAWFDAHKDYQGSADGLNAFAEALIERGSGHADVKSAKAYASVRASQLRAKGIKLPEFKRGVRKGQVVARKGSGVNGKDAPINANTASRAAAIQREFSGSPEE